MIGMKKIAALLVTAIVFLFASPTSFAEINDDWTMVRAKGYGLSPQGSNGKSNFDKTYARQAARLAAFREIAEMLTSFTVTPEDDGSVSTTTLLASRDMIARQVGDAKFTEELGDLLCEVTIEVAIWGKNSFAEEFFASRRDNPKHDFLAPRTPSNVGEKYTGLIIDCRGLRVPFSMLLSVKDQSDRSIYSVDNFDYETLIERGLFEVCKDVNAQTRAGAHPLIVRAVETDVRNAIITITDEDAELILNANRSNKVLERRAVVLIRQ